MSENQNKSPSKQTDDLANTKTMNLDSTKIYEIVHEHSQVSRKRMKAIKKSRRRYFWLKVRTVIVIFLLICEVMVGVIGLNMVQSMLKDTPALEIEDFVGEESSKIYDDNGVMIYELGVYLRENITYDKCPESLVDAFLSIEDSRFFSHFGFDIPRFTKAAIENLKNGDFGQGGSTFTMQLVKNTYFTVDNGDSSVERSKTIDYKVQQIWLSIKLETLLNKKEVFQLYMNRLNFGGNVRGVEKASIYYFGKSCTKLTLPESALLAGIINLPNGYNPYYYLDAATERRNEVLDMMVYHGYLTQTECDLAKAVKVEDLLAGDHRDLTENSEYQSYIDAAIEEAEKLTGLDPSVRGMEIYTYLNQTIQTEVDAIQNDERGIPFPDDLMQCAIICMDNQNGAIVAIGGGRNYDGARLLNRATMNFKQPGSSIKPVLSYALAFEYLGYTLDEVLIDKPITYPYESRVLVNATGKYEGDVMIKDAVAKSLNIPAILTLQRVVEKVGVDTVVNYMNAIGFSRVTSDNFHLSFAIGGTWFESTVKELAGAHSMIINGGVYNEPHTIQKIVTTNGTEYYPENQNKKVLSAGSAYLTAVLMENNVSGPYFNWMQILKRDYPVYAKTGTTDWGNDGLQYGIPAGAMKDKWMVASTSHYTNAVWVGYDMAIAGENTYFSTYKESLQIPGNINKLLLDVEESVDDEIPEGVKEPTSDLEEIEFIFGAYPHVKASEASQGSTVTSLVSKTGLSNSPLVTIAEYNEIKSEMETTEGGISASYDQYGTITIRWGSSDDVCAGGSKNISLHDQWGNDLDEWGTCIVDTSWLRTQGGGSYWATIYTDGYQAGTVSSTNGYYSGWVADLWGTVRVCGASTLSEESSCAVAAYNPIAEQTYSEDEGWWDENGEWHPYE